MLPSKSRINSQQMMYYGQTDHILRVEWKIHFRKKVTIEIRDFLTTTQHINYNYTELISSLECISM